MLKNRLNSFRFAFAGIRELFRSEPNAWIHLAVAILVIIGGWYFSLSPTEWCLVIFAIGAVLSAEAFNTAIEHLTDLVSPQYHELARKTKDAAAGAVLLMAMAAAAIGFIIFLPKIIALLGA
jgi:diacylglycerol kinase (ATP)